MRVTSICMGKFFYGDQMVRKKATKGGIGDALETKKR